MSRDCTDLVWRIELKPATLKLTLLSLADRADNDGYKCYPSIDRIVKDTSLNKKTVQANIKKLIELGLISDTGKRVGPTQKVRVLQINSEYIQNWNDTENGTLNVPENGTLNVPVFGMQNQSLNQSSNQSVINDRSKDQSDFGELVKKGFEIFWKAWKKAKSDIGKTDTSPKGETFNKKWTHLFNKKYFEENTEQDFKDEVKSMCQFVVKAHSLDGFNRFENMQTGRFLTQKQWRD